MPPAIPIHMSAQGIDLSGRVFRSATVVASPAAGSETTIATLTIGDNLALGLGVVLAGFAAFTVGTSGVSANLKLRQTGTSGTTVKATGATTVTAANLVSQSVLGLDTAAALPGQVYVLTLTVGSGAAESTVSAVTLLAIAV
jgi:hypothetical protein